MPTTLSHKHASGPGDNMEGARPRKSYRAARAFYLTLCIAICLAAFELFARPHVEQQDLSQHGLYKRDGVATALNDDEECRLVHRAKDQCAFIHTHCPDDEAGFSAYLDLYYCKLPHVKPVAFIILISWLGLLFSTIGIAASDFFCINLSTIASILGMSESLAGVTFLAFGNGSPDVFSTFAAMSTNSGSLAVGELMGAAGFITAVVAGSMALIRPFHVARKSFVRDVGFFVIAAAFSMVFLYDGVLHLWECLTMVVFYIFYVAFAVVWHWWLGRRRQRREKEVAARGHFLPPGDDCEVDQDEYHDDLEGEASRPTMSRGPSRDDFAALERVVGTPYLDVPNEDEEEEARDRWMSELNSNMRLSRPVVPSRRNTITPVRPSLVGALEFQAVLNSLYRSRNIQTIPLNARRYSDDPSFTTAQQQDRMSSTSDPAARPPYQVKVHENGPLALQRPMLDVPKSAPAGRTRAVSANDAARLKLDPDLAGLGPVPSTESLIDMRESTARNRSPSTYLEVPGQGRESTPQTPSFEISQASLPRSDSLRFSTQQIIPGTERSSSPEHLTSAERVPVLRQRNDSVAARAAHQDDTLQHSPRTVPRARRLPRIHIPRKESSRQSTPSSSPFPRYRENPSPAHSRPPSLYLPPPVASPETLPVDRSVEQEVPHRESKWWPHAVLPPPGVVISTLFPTVYRWHEKNVWERFLGVVAAPSVFLLTVTLPVVESDMGEVEDSQPPELSFDPQSPRTGNARGSLAGINNAESPQIASEPHTPGTHHHGSLIGGMGAYGNAATVAASTEQHQRHDYGEDSNRRPSIAHGQSNPGAGPAAQTPTDEYNPSELWNRWLTILQLLLAPLFVVLAIYSQSLTDVSPRWFLMPILICLLVSLLLLIPLLLTTTPTHRPPAYRIILSLAGFIVSIAWISTIAAQVVGALKALAVILNMSHAIMGLTIFAVGNSLGDLVADVTVARLGYPVMALSACFGGPMLNILLGIGLSGTYIMTRGAEHRQHKHPGQGLKFKSYHIDVGRTLIVSGITLLVTLVGLLIFVPLNKWVLSRRIGWALIAVWTLSTVGNVVLETTGWDGPGSED